MSEVSIKSARGSWQAPETSSRLFFSPDQTRRTRSTCGGRRRERHGEAILAIARFFADFAAQHEAKTAHNHTKQPLSRASGSLAAPWVVHTSDRTPLSIPVEG